MAGNAQAAYISGVTATTTITPDELSNISHITDGSGLSSQSFAATHAAATPSTVWAGSGTSGSVDFNLHGTYSLGGLAVWNFNGVNTVGVKDVAIFTSLDGSNYSLLSGAPTQFAIGAYGASETAEQFTFSPVTAAYVRFNITSNWGNSGAVGLSEVGFDGGAPSSSVPAPSALALFGIGAAAAVVRRRRAV